MWPWETGQRDSQGNGQLKGNLADNRNVGRESGSERPLPRFLVCKGDVLSLENSINMTLQ